MIVKLCHHLKENGIACHSAALRGQSYCYFHLRYKGHRLRTWRGRRSQPPVILDLPRPDSMAAIQFSLHQVLQALAADRIEVKYARRVLHDLNLASARLRGGGGDRGARKFLNDDWRD